MITHVFNLVGCDDGARVEELEQFDNRIFRFFVDGFQREEHGLVNELVVEMRHFQLLEAAGSLLHVVRRQILLKEETHRTHERLDWAQTTADTPDVVQSSHSMFHRQQHVGPRQSLPV